MRGLISGAAWQSESNRRRSMATEN